MRILKNPLVILVVCGVIVIVFAFIIHEGKIVDTAHSTFENYYAFRGCAQLLNKTDDYGICKTDSGQIIKIVKYQNKWYLDGDLPWACLDSICFGL